MRVVCENCGATYKIPEHKLNKEVNKATCRKCGHRMLIRRPAHLDPTPPPVVARPPVAPPQWAGPEPDSPEAWEDEAPTQIQRDPPAELASGSRPAPVAPAVPVAPATSAAAISPAGAAPTTPPRAHAAFDPAGDMGWALLGAVGAVFGALLLAINLTGNEILEFVGLATTLLGALTVLFILLTGARGRRKALILVSVFLSVFFAFAIAGARSLHALYDASPNLTRQLRTASEKLSTPTQAATPVPATTAEADRAVDQTIEELLADDEPGPEQDPVADAPEAAAEAEAPEPTPEPAVASAEPRSSSSSASSSQSTGSSSATRPSSSSTQSSRSSSSRSNSSRSSSSRSSSSTSSSQPSSSSRSSSSSRTSSASAPSSSSHSSSSSMQKLPLTVVDTIVRNNKSVKRCFYEEKQRAGSYPSRVDVKFTVLSAGSVSKAYVVTSQYRDSELDSCLSSAFRRLHFPPFEGDALSMTYPFVL